MQKRLNPWAVAICLLFVSFTFAVRAQAPANVPCTAPVIAVGNTPGSSPFTTINACCNTYSNFLGTGPACGAAVTNRDAWYEISGMTTGQQYNFLFIEKENRQTFVEIYELPAGKDCAVAANFKIVKCAQSNAVAFYVGTSISATFTVPSSTSKYYTRFQRATLGDEAIEGDFCVVKSYVNDEPCGAITLIQQPAKGTSPIFGQNYQSADWKPEVLTGPTCGPNNDVWYKFIPTTCDIEIFLKNLTPASYEMQAAILRSADGTCTGNMIDVTPCGGQPDQYLDITLSAKGLTIGQTYYVIVDGYSPPYFNATGNHSIELYTPANYTQCPNIIQSPCECGDPGNCPGLWYPGSQQGNTAVTLSVNANAPGCYDLKPFNVPLAGGSNTAEFCYEYTAKPGETLLAFESIVKRDPSCAIVSTGYQVHEVNQCTTPGLQPVCKDYNGKSPVYAVEPGKTYRFCRTITSDGGDLDCVNKTYDAICAYIWPMPANVTVNKTICSNETYSFGGTTYSTQGTYVKTLKSAATGCDSIATLVLKVSPAYPNQILNTTTCSNQPITIGTKTFDKSGTYKIDLKTASGCDSIITLNLNVKQAYDKILNVRKCQGETYTFGTGAALTTTGQYKKVFQAANGCDSTVTLNLFIPISPITSTVSKTICAGDKVIIGKDTLKTSGNYIKTIKSVAGCDSTINLTLTVSTKLENNLTKTLCFNEKIKIGANTYTSTGNYTDVIKSTSGCDSTVNLKLTVLAELKNTVSKTLCFGQTLTYPGGPYTKTGTYKVVLKSTTGCDSTITLNVTIPTKANETTITKNICGGDVVTINGVNYTTSTSIKFVSANGCDSVINLVINTSKDLQAAKDVTSPQCGSACNGSVTLTPTGGLPSYKIIWNTGSDKFKLTGLCAGTYSYTITDLAGCKKEESVTVAPNPPIVKTFTESVCKGAVFKFGTSTFTQSGSQTYKTAAGCDSTITVNLTVFDANISFVACGGPKGTVDITATGNDAPYTYSIDGGTTFQTSANFKDVPPGTKTIVVKGKSGCQFTLPAGPFVMSATPLTITVLDKGTPKTTVVLYTPSTTSPITVTAAGGTPTYTFGWSPVDLVKSINLPITTSPATTVASVTDALGCKVSQNIIYTVVNADIKIPQAFTPDGTGDKDNEVFQLYDPQGKIDSYNVFKVYSRWGELMYDAAKGTKLPGWNGSFKGEQQPSDTYIYLVEYLIKDNPTPVTLNGNVTLLR